MISRAEHVYTDQASVQRLESLIAELPVDGQVVLVLSDGSSCDGVVSAPPQVQVFRDADEHEGINARVQLRRPDAPNWSLRVWLDQVVRVEHLDLILVSEN